jgi:YVTN family beta-propeller protein
VNPEDTAKPSLQPPDVPTGTVTFLFTDIEESTALVRRLGDEYGPVRALHRRALRDAAVHNGGHEVDTQGDSFFFAFVRAQSAVAAAVDAQRALASQKWPAGIQVRVRMGLHTGEPGVDEEGYHGVGVVRAARLCALAHGGQILMSDTTRALLEDDKRLNVSLRDLGLHQLKGLPRPERVWQLVAEGLPDAFPSLETPERDAFAIKGRAEELEAAAQAAVSPPRLAQLKQRRVLWALVAALAAIAAVIAVLTTRGGATATSIEPNSVAVITSKGDRVVAAIRVGNTPTNVALGPNAVWVLNSREQTISRIDPRSRAVVRSFAAPSRSVGLAFGAGTLWITTADHRLARVDPLVNQVSRTTVLATTTSERFPYPSGISSDGHAVWASAPNEIVRASPAPFRRIHVGNVPCCVALAIGDSAVWATEFEGVDRIDLTTGETTHVALPFFSSSVTFADGAVWVADQTGDTVWQIDSQTHQVARTIPVGGHPTDVAAGAGGVWVTTANGKLVELDPSGSRIVRSLALGGTPSAVAVGNGFIWVAID